jgi:hypothetical protein
MPILLTTSSVAINNTGSTILTVTVPGETSVTINPKKSYTCEARGTYTVAVGSTIAFTLTWRSSELKVTKGSDESTDGTSATINSHLY